MIRSSFFIFCFVSIVIPVGGVWAQASPPSPNYEVLDQRKDGISALVVIGDSIAGGYAFNVLSTRLNNDFLYGEPNANLRSPGHVLQTLLSELDLAPPIVAYGGGSGLPDIASVNFAVSRYSQDFEAGRLRAGDTLMIVDAGDHRCNVDSYIDSLDYLINSLAELELNILHFLSFDILSASSDPGLTCYRWNEPFSAEFPSMNQAINHYYESNQDIYSKYKLVDKIDEMGSLRERLIEQYGVDIMDDDGIHQNAWGNIVIARIALQELGVDPESIRALAEEGEFRDHVLKWGHRFTVNLRGRILTPAESGEILEIILGPYQSWS